MVTYPADGLEALDLQKEQRQERLIADDYRPWGAPSESVE
jgi:hypothetical protein